MAKQKYTCMKCEGTEYRTGELRTTGSGITRFLNIQNQKYATLACGACGYTELYRLDGSGKFGNILDLLTNQIALCYNLPEWKKDIIKVREWADKF